MQNEVSVAVPDVLRPDVSCGSRTTELALPCTVAWTDTGIDLRAGDRLQIQVTGRVRYGTSSLQEQDADGGDPASGQRFFDNAVYPTTVIVSVIGKVGGSTDLDTGTPLREGTAGAGPGFVGTRYDGRVETSGRLFLGYNDQRIAFSDNAGDFRARITTGCP